MKFDAYGATVPDAAEEVVGALTAKWPALWWRPAVPRHGSAFAAEGVYGDRVAIGAKWGGGIPVGVHVQAQGEWAEPWARYCRQRWPDHRVSRLDACEDFDAPGAWDALASLCLRVADDAGVVVKHEGDFHRAERGRTLYLGAPSSVLRVRLYEKGKQLAAAGDPSARPDHVRLEAQARPQREGKAAAASVMPAQVFGMAAWSAELLARVAGTEVPRITVGSVWSPSDDERAYRWMIRQYGPMLQRLAAALGSWECVGLTIGADCAPGDDGERSG